MQRSLYPHVAKLAILDLLVEEGTFKRACARARVTQSALSQTISGLEGLLGLPLIVRDAGSVRPTPQCQELLAKVRPILLSLDAVAAGLASPTTSVPALASLDLGIHESLAIRTVPRLAERLRGIFPHLHLNLRTGRSGELAALVRKGELCMAVITELDQLGKLPTHVLGTDRLGVYVAPQLDRSADDRELIARLGLGSLAAPKEGYPTYFSRFLRHHKLPKPWVFSAGFEALRAMAAAGTVAAVLPARVAQRSGAQPLRELNLNGAKAGTHQILLISQKSCSKDESAFIADELQRLHESEA